MTNPKGQLKGVWTDPAPVPDDIVTLGLAQNLVDDPIASEAVRAVQHFGYNPNATYIVLTPPAKIGTGEGGLLRLPHADHERRRARQPGADPVRVHPVAERELAHHRDGGCGMHNVNATSDAFGNGIFDGWSIAPVTSTPKPSPTPTTSRRFRTAGTTTRRRKTATSAPGSTRRTSRSARTSSRCSRSGATRRSTRPATAASSQARRATLGRRGRCARPPPFGPCASMSGDGTA